MLEIAAVSWEGVPWEGARATSTNAHETEQTHLGAEARQKQRGGHPRQQERHGVTTLILDRPPPESLIVRRVSVKPSVPMIG
jgi:hypothetical protein